jgi:hypothetical protein
MAAMRASRCSSAFCSRKKSAASVRASAFRAWPTMKPPWALDRDQTHPAIGEVDDLQGFRVIDQAAQIVGDFLFRADDVIDCRNARGKTAFRMASCSRCARMRANLVGMLNRVAGQFAGDHIGLVVLGHRDQHVGIVGARLAKYGRVRRLTTDGAQIVTILQGRQVWSRHRHRPRSMSLASRYQADGQIGADLAGSKNDDLQDDSGEGWKRSGVPLRLRCGSGTLLPAA